MKPRKSIGKFVLCIRNEGCEEELRKLYRELPDKSAAAGHSCD